MAKSRLHTISSTDSKSMLGAGYMHKNKPFITHSTLPYNLSAVTLLTNPQKLGLFLILALIIGFLFKYPLSTAITLVSLLTLAYFTDVLFTLLIIGKSINNSPELSFSDHELSSLNPRFLPTYSVLCPMFREAKILPSLIENLSKLDWPKNKLEILLLLEENDTDTIDAARSIQLPSFFRILIVPRSLPKTKPKACNYGLNFVTGKYLVIYDAEDQPDYLQLKKAYMGFQSSPKNVACLQAKLNYYNPRFNLLTRLFTVEYSLWFDLVLPGLQSVNTIIPLGGTSNHFKTSILKKLHGWDAFNVTEDCDLGARLFKLGYKTSIIDSVTLEEANSRWGNWIRQRSRWIKGYLQTFFVHNRHPIQFVRQHGWHALIFQLVIGLRIVFILINPLMWLVTLSYFLLYPIVGSTIHALYPGPVLYLASFSAIFGNFLFMYNNMIGIAKRGDWYLVKYVYLIPLYWMMISLASVKAVYQLIVKPHFWEKTHHGISLSGSRLPIWPKISLRFSWISSPSWPIPAGLLIVATLIGNLFSYLLNVYLGRNIPSPEFGLVSLIGGFIYVVGVPFSALANTVTFRSAFIKGKIGQIPAFIRQRFVSKAVIFGFVLSIIWLISSPNLAHYFNTTNLIAFWIFAPVLVMGFSIAVDGGILLGAHRFDVLAAVTVVESMSKFGLAYMFIRLNQPGLIYVSIPLSMLISYIVLQIFALRIVRPLSEINNHQWQSFPRKFFVTSLLSSLSTIAFFSFDIILAKKFLNPEMAGTYALVSLVGKIIFFIGRLSSQFITPYVSRQEGRGQDPRTVFRPIFLSASILSLAAYLIVGPFGYLVNPILFGHRILPALPYLPLFGAGMVAFTLSTVIVSYHQARQHHEFPIVAVFASLLQILLLVFYHRSLQEFVLAMFSAGLVNLVLTSFMHVYYESIRIVISNFHDFFGVFELFKNGYHSLPNGKLRILIFNWRDTRHVWAGGAEVYLQELAARWVKDGHKVTIFCGHDSQSPKNSVVSGVKIIRRGGFFTIYLWAPLYYLLRLRGRYDLIIDSENGIPFFAPLFTRLPVFLLIYHVHQEYFRKNLPPVLSQFAMFLEAKLMPLVYRRNHIITISKSSSLDIQNIFKISSDRIDIVNPGIDLNSFCPGKKTTHPSLLYLGRIRPYKNVDIAIKAFATILPRYPQAILTIAGWGENLPQLKQLAKELGIETSVNFRHRVTDSEKISLLQQSWITLQPSSIEGWGITVIEANACGTPVIASNTIGLKDSVIDGQTGILTPLNQPQKMAEHISFLLSQPQILSQMSNRAIIWASNHDWQQKADSFINILKFQLFQTRPSIWKSLIPEYLRSKNL